MCNELLSWECWRDSQLESSFRLTVRSTEVAFDPDVVVVDQVAVKFCHRSLWNTTEEYYKTTFFYHVDTLGLCCIYRSSGDNFVCAFSTSQFFYCFDWIFFRTVNCDVNTKIFSHLKSIMITFWAPRIFASCAIKQPIGPAPMITNVSG